MFWPRVLHGWILSGVRWNMEFCELVKGWFFLIIFFSFLPWQPPSFTVPSTPFLNALAWSPGLKTTHQEEQNDSNVMRCPSEGPAQVTRHVLHYQQNQGKAASPGLRGKTLMGCPFWAATPTGSGLVFVSFALAQPWADARQPCATLQHPAQHSSVTT